MFFLIEINLIDITIKSLLIHRFPLLLLFSLSVYVLWFFAVVLFFCRNQVICSVAFHTLDFADGIPVVSLTCSFVPCAS